MLCSLILGFQIDLFKKLGLDHFPLVEPFLPHQLVFLLFLHMFVVVIHTEELLAIDADLPFNISPVTFIAFLSFGRHSPPS